LNSERNVAQEFIEMSLSSMKRKKENEFNDTFVAIINTHLSENYDSKVQDK